MKVRETFKDPDYSPFTREAVKVGELLEGQGWVLQDEHYSQGTQSFHFRKGMFRVDVHIEEED